MRDFEIDKLHPQVIYLKTDKMKSTPTSKFQPDTIVEGEFEYSSYMVKVTHISDRGDYFYVGYHPLDGRHGQFGYTRIYKEEATRPPFGTIGFEDTRTLRRTM